MERSESIQEWLCSKHCDFQYSEGNWITWRYKGFEFTYQYIGGYSIHGIETRDGRRFYNPRQLKKYLKKLKAGGNENV